MMSNAVFLKMKFYSHKGFSRIFMHVRMLAGVFRIHIQSEVNTVDGCDSSDKRRRQSIMMCSKYRLLYSE